MKLNISKYRTNVYSQCGEDGVIEKLFSLANITTGWLVEFGAWDGIYLSNTYHHHKNNRNFKVMYIESSEERFGELTKNIRWDDNAILLNHKIELSGDNSLTNVLTKYQVNDIALLSIDVDGEDLNIWNSLDKTKFRPKIVIIEEGNWADKDALDYLNECFVKYGYNLVCVTGNFIFIRNDLGISSKQDIHELMKTSGSPEYQCLNKLISEEQRDILFKRQYAEKDFFSKYAEPQYIYIHEA